MFFQKKKLEKEIFQKIENLKKKVKKLVQGNCYEDTFYCELLIKRN